MPYELIGRTTSYKGKSLWEILGNLKNFGVGRLVIRNKFQRYPEPSYYKILKVAALPDTPQEPFQLDRINDTPLRKVRVLVERTFRGQTFEKLVQLEEATYKTDYQLVPKDEEYKYLEEITQREERILPNTVEFPPLLRELVIRSMKAKGIPITKEPQMKLRYNFTGQKIYRVAKEGEEPNVKLTIGLGTPLNPSLYANCKPI